MGCVASSTSSGDVDYSHAACTKTKCGGKLVDIRKQHQGILFPTVKQVPLSYLKEKFVLTCQVVNVPDGDTVRCRHVPGGVVQRDPLQKHRPWRKRLKPETLLIRLYGVDAPERAKFRQPGQPFAEEARNLVVEKLLDRVVYVKLLSVDQYGRALCRILYVALADYNAHTTPPHATTDNAGYEIMVGGQLQYHHPEYDSKGTLLPEGRSWWCLCARRMHKQKVVEKDICDDLLLHGLAVVYRGHGGEYDERYAELVSLESIAKQNLRGIWSLEQPQLPGDYKKQQQQLHAPQGREGV